MLCIDRWRPNGFLSWIAPNFPPPPSRVPFLLHPLIIAIFCTEVTSEFIGFMHITSPPLKLKLRIELPVFFRVEGSQETR